MRHIDIQFDLKNILKNKGNMNHLNMPFNQNHIIFTNFDPFLASLPNI